MADFTTAYNQTLGHEGGYVNDPQDRGGETYKGIAREFHPRWNGWEVIDKLKDEPDFPDCLATHDSLQRMVKQFYKDRFWNPAELDVMESQQLADELFDTGVNQGMQSAIEYMQEALNMLNRDEEDFHDIAVDGVFGKQTRQAYQQYLATGAWSTRSVQACIRTLVKLINALQAERYINIVRNDASQERFMFGWLNRVAV
jgi:lysozyme family protein